MVHGDRFDVMTHVDPSPPLSEGSTNAQYTNRVESCIVRRPTARQQALHADVALTQGYAVRFILRRNHGGVNVRVDAAPVTVQTVPRVAPQPAQRCRGAASGHAPWTA